MENAPIIFTADDNSLDGYTLAGNEVVKLCHALTLELNEYKIIILVAVSLPRIIQYEFSFLERLPPGFGWYLNHRRNIMNDCRSGVFNHCL